MGGFPGITREPGESEADFGRRYNREKQRFYRAQKPKSDRKRGKGKGPAKNGKLTQEEWEALQQQPGETATEHRRRYNRHMQAKYRVENAVRLAEERRAAYAANPGPERERNRRRREENPERQRAYERRYRENNPEMAAKRMASLREWGVNNADRLKDVKRAWNEANRGFLASYSAKWRKSCRIATPAWADFDAIRLFYDEARRISERTGIPHEVDHIIPVQGRSVCGLHVHTNLRIIPAGENSRKHNTFDPELLEFFERLNIW